MTEFNYITFFGILKLSTLLITVTTAESTIVSTPSGQVEGKTVEYKNETVYQFLRIPYAKSPTGSLRFRKPQPYGSWNHTLDATRHPPSCAQKFQPTTFDNNLPNTESSEDCLFLNIYVPRDISTSNKKAVMIWIHGGGFLAGTASTYDGSDLALTGDVIVVFINYRLGLFGFFSTGDSASPGNFGLWDQRMAIQWVKSNIAAFGGDPTSITIFGESAGGISVSYQALSPHNRGLFQRVIAQSGCANAATLTNNVHKDIVQLVKSMSGCGISPSNNALVDCLRQKSTEEILNMTTPIVYHFVTQLEFSVYYTPTVDGDFLTALPDDILKDPSSKGYKTFQSVDYISGVMTGEGSVFLLLLEMLGVNVTAGVSKDLFCGRLVPGLSASFYNGSKVVSDALCQMYGLPDGNTDIGAQAAQVADLFGDLTFIAPSVRTLDSHSKENAQSKTYQFVLSRVLPISLGSPIPWYDKAIHGTDEFFLFDPKIRFPLIMGIEPTEADLKLSHQMMKYWTNFAKTGNPNSEDLPNWPEYNADTQPYIDLNLNITHGNKLFSDRIDFIQTLGDLEETKTVSTPSGQVKGKVTIYKNERVYQFLRIPYAKSPTGPLRFRKPQPYGSWNHTLVATRHPPRCAQEFLPATLAKLLPHNESSEDCLFLNIFVPRDVSTSNRKAVMIWIHGGGFFAGMASGYDGSDLALTGDVIVVFINYRLGLFGFFSTGDSASPGNFGLWDQRMAIEWVKSNIPAFGGDPTSITIFGESAGGMSVSYQALSPHNRGLFQRVIAQSGSANAPTLSNDVHKEIAQLVKSMSDCGMLTTNDALVDCLRQKSTDEILNMTTPIVYHFVAELEFSDYCIPTVDGDFLPALPDDILNDTSSEGYKTFQSVDFISGVMNGDGSIYLFFLEVLGVNVTAGVSKDMFCESLAPALSASFYNGSKVVSDAMCQKYGLPDGNTNIGAQASQVTDLLGDLIFNAPSVKTLDSHSKENSRSKTYQFVLSRALPFSLGSPIPWYDKTTHGTDELYLFDPKIRFPLMMGIAPTEDDLKLSKQMMTYWTNFAKTGNPNDENLPNWPEYDVNTKSYIDLNLNITQGNKLFGDRMDFIKSLRQQKDQDKDKRPDDNLSDDSFSRNVIIAITVSIASLLVVIVIFLFLLRRYQMKNSSKAYISEINRL